MPLGRVPVAQPALCSRRAAGYRVRPNGPGGGRERTPNVPKIRSALDVYNSGDHEGMKAFLADGIAWHFGGNHEMSGDYRGVDAVLGYFRDVRRKAAGILRVEAEETWPTTDTHRSSCA